MKKELLGPASGGVTAHNYKGLSGALELDGAHLPTVGIVAGALAERPMRVHGKAGKRGCVPATFAKSAFFFPTPPTADDALIAAQAKRLKGKRERKF